MAGTDKAVLAEWFLDPDALALADMLVDLTQTWDDLIDRDQAVSNNEINRMMCHALIGIPKNLFYQKHFLSLSAVMEDRFYTWFDANMLEHEASHESLRVAYYLRNVVADIIIHMTFLEGGLEHRKSLALEIRKRIYADQEPLEEYLAEHGG